MEFEHIRRDVPAFLTSLRQAVDRPFRARGPSSEADRDQFLRTMIMIEEERIRFNTYTRYQETPSRQEWNIIRKNLMNFVEGFIHSKLVDPGIFERRFRIFPINPRDRDNPTRFISSVMGTEISVADALVAFREYIKNADVDAPSSQTVMDFGDLERIVPRQQLAPVQFDVANGRLIVRHQASRSLEGDQENIATALQHIRESGEALIENLKNSNCDRRLLESVEELHSQICSGENAVKVGLTNMACGIMSSKFQDELPDAISAMVNSYNTSISMYVSQFPDWEKFTEKASRIDLDEDDIAEVDAASVDLIHCLSQNPALSDPEVPKTIAFVRQFLLLPGTSAKRAAFAMIRTIENLVSSICHHALCFLDKTAEKTVEATSSAASKVIAGMLGLALIGASGIGSAAVQAGSPWVKQAAEIVQKQLDDLAR